MSPDRRNMIRAARNSRWFAANATAKYNRDMAAVDLRKLKEAYFITDADIDALIAEEGEFVPRFYKQRESA